jgi:hypothetical protein
MWGAFEEAALAERKGIEPFPSPCPRTPLPYPPDSPLCLIRRTVWARRYLGPSPRASLAGRIAWSVRRFRNQELRRQRLVRTVVVESVGENALMGDRQDQGKGDG